MTLAGVAFGQTVLSRALLAAGLPWDGDQAHSAVYDAERTADLFCLIANRWGRLAPVADVPVDTPLSDTFEPSVDLLP